MKIALITGANKSIGFETTKQLIQRGYFVYLGSRDTEKGEAAVQELKSQGLTTVEAIQIDISDRESVRAAKQVIADKSGLLDVLINNAGILGVQPQSAAVVDTEEIREVFNTNFFGTIDVTHTFLDLLRKSASPVIVNVTSGLASLTLHKDPSWIYYAYKTGAYGPSKTALNAYTVALAYELGDAFRVNAVDPGLTATDFNNFHGDSTPAEAAAFVASYAVLDASGPTGQFFSRDIAAEDRISAW